jgi:hypothetical protein
MLIRLNLKKESELANFLSINNLDIAAIRETQLASKHRFPTTGYFVYRSERNQFVGGVMLLVKNNARRDQFVLTTVVNLESVAVYIFRIIPVSCLFLVITHPNSQFCILTSIRSFPHSTLLF